MFVYGTQYYRPPNPPRRDRARDLGLIKIHGFNTVKNWVMWSWIHVAPGRFDFDEMDELMQLAAERGLRVVLNTILEAAPYWLIKECPEARYIANDGTVVNPQPWEHMPVGGWPGLCYHHPRVKQEATNFLEALATRYRSHGALFAYDVWNEPNLEPLHAYPKKLFCYCENSVEEFRKWLEKKYGSLDALSQVWARRLTSWQEVRPPDLFHTYPDMMDWRRFWMEAIEEILTWKVEAVRRCDNEHTITTHPSTTTYLVNPGANSWDEWLLFRHVDIGGTSSFPTWQMRDPTIHFLTLDAIRSAAFGKQFWQSELQGGPAYVGGIRKSATPEPEDIRVWNWTALAAGAKGVLYWQWRSELLGPEAPGFGLCNSNGIPTPRAEMAGKMAGLITACEPLTRATPVPPESAILLSRDAALFTFAAEEAPDLYTFSIQGAYRAFFDRNIPVAFIHTDSLQDTISGGHVEFIYFPLPLCVSKETAELLKSFVNQGGTLFAEACAGRHDEHGWASPVVPGQGLRELFGVEEIETRHADKVSGRPAVSPGEPALQPFSGMLYLEKLKALHDTTRVLAVDESGAPLLMENRFGKGRAILAGTFPALAYEKTRDTSTGNLITVFAPGPAVGVNVVEGSAAIKTRVHRIDTGYLVFVVNIGDREETVRVKLNGIPGAEALDAFSGQSIAATDGFIDVKVDRKDGRLILAK